VRLKKYYSSREVASLTGLTARQLQWWDARRLFPGGDCAAADRSRRLHGAPIHAARRAGTAGARGPAPPRLLIPRLRRLLSTLRRVFGVRLYEAIGDGGPLTLFIGGDQLFARTATDSSTTWIGRSRR
jgi:hypothetical protein